MKLYTLGTEEDRWVWHTLSIGEGARLHLYMTDTQQLNRVRRKFVPNEDRQDLAGMQRYVARNWFDDFKELYTPSGEEIENTLDNRFKILQHPGVWSEVQDVLTKGSSDIEEEGKDNATD